MPDTLAPPANDALPLAIRSELRFLTCGSVDDGKSTLIGRLISDAAGLHDDQIASLRDDSRRFGTTEDEFDFALLLDGLEAEREQGITIDVAYRFFSTARRAFVVADTPGHQQYTRNMATGASNAELAVLLVDARKGLVEQTRRHAAIVSLLGIRHVVLAVNKIDLVEFSEARFREIEAAFAASPHRLPSIRSWRFRCRRGWATTSRAAASARPGMPVPRCSPISRRSRPTSMPPRRRCASRCSGSIARTASSAASPAPWHRGASLSAIRSSCRAPAAPRTVARIVSFDGDLPSAAAGRSVTLTLADEVDVIRGDVLADPQASADRDAALRGRPGVDGRGGGDAGQALPAQDRHGDRAGHARPHRRHARRRLADAHAGGVPWPQCHRPRRDRDGAARGLRSPMPRTAQTGAFILIDRSTLRTAAAGMVVESLDAARHVHRHAETVTPALRAEAKAQRPLVVWLTGLPGSGKSTIANLVESKLAALGRQTMLLDGDNLRQGLNADLGFDAAGRSENVRRVGEVAKLMTDAGLIVIVALVSPFRADRTRAAALLARGPLPGDLRRYADRDLPAARSQGPLREGRPGQGRRTSPAATSPTNRRTRRAWCCARRS